MSMAGGEGPFGAIDMVGMFTVLEVREELASWLGRKVDFTTRNGLHRDLRERIARSAIKVFDDAAVHSIAAE